MPRLLQATDTARRASFKWGYRKLANQTGPNKGRINTPDSIIVYHVEDVLLYREGARNKAAHDCSKRDNTGRD